MQRRWFDSFAGGEGGLPAVDPFEDAAIGMALLSIDGRFVRVNAALCELLDRDRTILLRASWHDVAHPADVARSGEQFEALVGGRRRCIDISQRCLRPDGGVIVAHVTSALVVLDGVPMVFSQLRDATDEHDALAALWASERRWRTFTDSSSDVILWRRLAPDGRFIFASDTTTGVTGYSPADFYADPALGTQVVHADDRHLIDQLQAKPEPGGALVRWVRRDGAVIWMEQRVTALATVDGQSTDILWVARDVTERVTSDMARARHDAQQRAVTAFAHACIANHEPATLLDEASATVRRLVPGDLTAAWWEVEPAGEFRLASGAGFGVLEVGRAVVDATMSHPARVRLADGLASFHRRGHLADAEAEDELEGEGVRSGIGVPIRSAGHVAGVIASYSRSDVQFAPEDVTFLQAVANIVGACMDRAHFDAQLSFQSLHDPLTGLPTRTLLVEHLARALAASVDGSNVVVVAMCDLDDFQLFREALGHDLGDELLVAVASRLEGIARGALVARVAGDDFALVLTCAASDARIDTLASEIIAVMQSPFSLGSREVTATLSVGLATAHSTVAAEDTLASALAALHRARARGRGQWLYSEGDEQANALRRLDLTTRLRHAVNEGAIEAHFQPIVCLRHGGVVGYEALARWTIADGVSVTPAEFIPIAEETGLIDALGLSMLEQACAFLQRTHDLSGRRELMVTVNVSPRQLESPKLVAELEEVLSRYRMPRTAICLELTESALVPGDHIMIERLNALKRVGVSLAIDDFGIGYSSFAYLTSFPIDLLKLDRAFATTLHDDPRRIAVVRSIIGLGRTLGIVVLAEGIETAAERDVLTELGCELGQGMLWSKPTPAAAATAALAKRSQHPDAWGPGAACPPGCGAALVRTGKLEMIDGGSAIGGDSARPGGGL